MNKRGAEESLSFLTGIVIAIIIAIPMFMLIWNFVESTSIANKDFDELVDVIKSMGVGDEREFGLFIKDNAFLGSFNEDQDILKSDFLITGECKFPDDWLVSSRFSSERSTECGEDNCLCLCNVKRKLDGTFNFRDACNTGQRCRTFEDVKIVGKCFDTENIFIPGIGRKEELVTLQLEKKEIDGSEVVGICVNKPCIK